MELIQSTVMGNAGLGWRDYICRDERSLTWSQDGNARIRRPPLVAWHDRACPGYAARVAGKRLEPDGRRCDIPDPFQGRTQRIGHRTGPAKGHRIERLVLSAADNPPLGRVRNAPRVRC